MGLMEALRKAEQQGRGVAHRGFERARETWDDAERRIRRKMRIFPGSMQRQAISPPLSVPKVDLDRVSDGSQEIPRKRTA